MFSLLLWGFLLLLFSFSNSQETLSIAGSHIDEERGFYLQDFELRSPFQNLYSAWDTTGDALMINSRISLTRDQSGMKGGLWSRNHLQERDWEATAAIRMHGSSGKLHAEGIALWYISEVPESAHVFGISERFKGLGILFDTYKNDEGNYDSFPRISVVLNDGKKVFDWGKDGANLNLGHCHVPGGAQSPDSDSRSTKAFRILVRYYMENVEVYYAQYEDLKWTLCTSVANVRLPTDYIFGMSASTGDLTSNHEISSFKVNALNAPPHSSPPPFVPEQRKLVKESAPIVAEAKRSGWGMKIFCFVLFLILCCVGFAIYKAVWVPKAKLRKRFY